MSTTLAAVPTPTLYKSYRRFLVRKSLLELQNASHVSLFSFHLLPP